VQVALAALTLFSLVPAVSHAQGYPVEGARTVDWYAKHPAERDRVRRVCLNDPGHLERTPDCINAARGDLAATAVPPAQSNGGGFLAPLPPSYWAARPNERALKLAYCRRMAPADQAAAGCGAVFQSLSMAPETR
jgi:hypothetical protein